jgi:hypothetical protein
MEDNVSVGLSYQARVPMCHRKSGTEALSDPDRYQNTAFIRAFTVLEDHSVTAPSDPHDESLVRLAGLEARVDLLMQMTGMLLMQHLNLPAERAVTLSPDYITWEQTGMDEMPVTGDALELEVYLLTGLPFMLILPVKVTGVVPSADGYQVTAGYNAIPENLYELLLRIIFRQHRRNIAITRRAGGRNSAAGPS